MIEDGGIRRASACYSLMACANLLPLLICQAKMCCRDGRHKCHGRETKAGDLFYSESKIEDAGKGRCILRQADAANPE